MATRCCPSGHGESPTPRLSATRPSKLYIQAGVVLRPGCELSRAALRPASGDHSPPSPAPFAESPWPQSVTGQALAPVHPASAGLRIGGTLPRSDFLIPRVGKPVLL